MVVVVVVVMVVVTRADGPEEGMDGEWMAPSRASERV
jgi:hypothetical protein